MFLHLSVSHSVHRGFHPGVRSGGSIQGSSVWRLGAIQGRAVQGGGGQDVVKGVL